MKSQYSKKLIMLYMLLLGVISCGSFVHKNKFEWSELSNATQEGYISGFSQENVFIAKQVIDHLKNDELSDSCESKSEPINFINEELPKPQNHLSEQSDLYQLNVLIQSDNQLVRDLSLYIVSQLGPTASELLPWLKYYQSQDYYYSHWIQSAIESVSCQEWILTRFNQRPKSKLIKTEFIKKLERMVSEELLFPPNEIHDFITGNLDGMDDNIKSTDLLKFINADYIKEPIKAEIISALPVGDIDILKNK